MPIHRPAAILAAALLLVACNPPAPTSSAPATVPPTTQPGTPAPGSSQGSATDTYRSIRQEVEAIRGLQPTADVDPVTIDAEQLRTNLTTEFDKENPADELGFSEDSLIALGLLPKGSSLRTLTLDFQAGQVAGYYSPDAKELFVVSRSGDIGPAEKVTYAHEFTHQLTDQRFDLSKLGEDAANQSDRALAQLALVEGDAVSVQTTWTIQTLTPEEMGELLRASLDPAALEALRNAPPYLRETSLFPYQDGLTFVSGLIAGGGYDAVNAAYGDPPESTEQVLHPEKFSTREAPIEVKLPTDLAKEMGAGWTEAGQDTLGEFVLRLWLTQNGVPTAQAAAAAAGWSGDRLVLLQGPDGSVTLGLVTQWDTVADKNEFRAAAVMAAQNGDLDYVIQPLTQSSRQVLFGIGPGANRLVDALLAP